MAANRYHALVVRLQTDRGQTVVTGGPYRFVRHPTYLASIAMAFASPLARASAWALIPGALSGLLLLIRALLEDRALQRELNNYREYAGRVRYRLLPGVG